MDLDAARLAVAEEIVGAQTIVADDAALDAAAALTGGDGFDIVFDATGNARSMQNGFTFVAHGGTYVLVSVVKSQISFEDPDFHRKEMSLLGSRNATSEDFQRVIAAIAAGRVPIDKLITHRDEQLGVPAPFHFDRHRRRRSVFDLRADRREDDDVDAFAAATACGVRPDLELTADHATSQPQLSVQTADEPGRQFLFVFRCCVPACIPQFPGRGRRAAPQLSLDSP